MHPCTLRALGYQALLIDARCYKNRHKSTWFANWNRYFSHAWRVQIPSKQSWPHEIMAFVTAPTAPTWRGSLPLFCFGAVSWCHGTCHPPSNSCIQETSLVGRLALTVDICTLDTHFCSAIGLATGWRTVVWQPFNFLLLRNRQLQRSHDTTNIQLYYAVLWNMKWSRAKSLWLETENAPLDITRYWKRVKVHKMRCRQSHLLRSSRSFLRMFLVWVELPNQLRW